MLLPLLLLTKAQIDLRRKLALTALFSLTFVTIAFSIARAAVVINSPGVADGSLISLWSSLEHTVAIIIACLVSYRTWFTRNGRSDNRSSGKTYVARCRGIEAGPVGTEMETGKTLVEGKRETIIDVEDGGSWDAKIDSNSCELRPFNPLPREVV